MKFKKEQFMIIQALSTCIARKKQKSNRKKRILQKAELLKEPKLHQLRRSFYNGLEEIEYFELLKEKLESMINQTIGIKTTDAYVTQSVDENGISHSLTVKSFLTLEIEGFEMVKEISNTVLIDNEMILDLIRQKNNISILNNFINNV